MNLDDLRRIGNSAKKSAFRLETLSQYLVPQEAEDFATWQAGRPIHRQTPENNEGLARIQRDTARGFRRYRVHILDLPLTDYLRFELHGYLDSTAAGSEIYVVDRDTHPSLGKFHEDFWLFDDETAIRMIYDTEGYFLYPELVNDIEHYREIRDVAMFHAEPLHDYLTRKGLTPEALRIK